MQKKITELQNGDSFNGTYILKDAQIRQTKTGKSFLDGSLSDVSGTLKIKFWDFSKALPETGVAYDVAGNISEYMGNNQAVLNKLAINENPGAAVLTMLVPSSPTPTDQIMDDLNDMLTKYVHDPKLLQMSATVIHDNLDTFKVIPAAKTVHHEFLGGLATHVHEMLILEDKMLEAVDAIYKPYNDKSEDKIVVNKELLTVSIIFHDIGKIREFTIGKLGTVTDYSVEGHLLGHIYMSAEYIAEMCEQCGVDEEKSMMLQSMILSHHGKPEYGSAITPQFLEAFLLHEIDEIDAKLQIFREAWLKTTPGEFCPDKQWALDNIQPYRPSWTGTTTEAKESESEGGVETLRLDI